MAVNEENFRKMEIYTNISRIGSSGLSGYR